MYHIPNTYLCALFVMKLARNSYFFFFFHSLWSSMNGVVIHAYNIHARNEIFEVLYTCFYRLKMLRKINPSRPASIWLDLFYGVIYFILFARYEKKSQHVFFGLHFKRSEVDLFFCFFINDAGDDNIISCRDIYTTDYNII